MGDRLDDATDRFYGNNQLNIEGMEHGHFVASVVAGVVADDVRYNGVWPQARLMAIRISPEGDEYDKDVASGIRYAVDNGAKVVNLSFGKYTSPHPEMVNEAIAYAAKHDVLVIAAAGNNHLNIDSVDFLPQLMPKAKRLTTLFAWAARRWMAVVRLSPIMVHIKLTFMHQANISRAYIPATRKILPMAPVWRLLWSQA